MRETILRAPVARHAPTVSSGREWTSDEEPAARSRSRDPASVLGIAVTERRRRRTDRAVGCTTAQVLKTCRDIDAKPHESGYFDHRMRVRDSDWDSFLGRSADTHGFSESTLAQAASTFPG